jgi:hypothetical protein
MPTRTAPSSDERSISGLRIEAPRPSRNLTDNGRRLL